MRSSLWNVFDSLKVAYTDPAIRHESGESSTLTVMTSEQVGEASSSPRPGRAMVAGGAFSGVIKIEGHRQTIYIAASDFEVQGCAFVELRWIYPINQQLLLVDPLGLSIISDRNADSSDFEGF